MIFGEDIYALSVAMLHKKNAKHLKYFDQDEEKNHAREHLEDKHGEGAEDKDCGDKDDHNEMQQILHEKTSFPPIMTFVIICATFTFTMQVSFMGVIMSEFKKDNVFYHLNPKGLNVSIA